MTTDCIRPRSIALDILLDCTGAGNGNLEVLVYSLKARQGYTVMKIEKR
jgi:hypothetical protein